MIERVPAREVYDEIRDGKDILLLDVRRGSWNESNVKARGALRIPPDEISIRYEEIPADKEIAAYCT